MFRAGFRYKQDTSSSTFSTPLWVRAVSRNRAEPEKKQTKMLTAAERKTETKNAETKNTETKKVEAKKKPSLRFYLLRDMVGNFSADWVLPEKNWRLAFWSKSHLFEQS